MGQEHRSTPLTIRILMQVSLVLVEYRTPCQVEIPIEHMERRPVCLTPVSDLCQLPHTLPQDFHPNLAFRDPINLTMVPHLP